MIIFATFIVVGVSVVVIDYIKAGRVGTVLTVSVFDVGDGFAALIGLPDGGDVLVDGGGYGGGIVRWLEKVEPFYADALDAIIVTDGAQNDVAGLFDVVRHYSVAKVYTLKNATSTAILSSFISFINNEGNGDNGNSSSLHVPVVYLAQGGTVMLDRGHGVYARVLYPPAISGDMLKGRAATLVFTLSYGTSTFIFLGNADAKTEAAISGRLVASDTKGTIVMMVPHQGSADAISQAFLSKFLSKADPHYAVISVSTTSRYGYPKQATIDMLAAAGVHTNITSRDGTVQYKTDGISLHVGFIKGL
jgi:competence protein ComEC